MGSIKILQWGIVHNNLLNTQTFTQGKLLAFNVKNTICGQRIHMKIVGRMKINSLDLVRQ